MRLIVRVYWLPVCLFVVCITTLLTTYLITTQLAHEPNFMPSVRAPLHPTLHTYVHDDRTSAQAQTQ